MERQWSKRHFRVIGDACDLPPKGPYEWKETSSNWGKNRWSHTPRGLKAWRVFVMWGFKWFIIKNSLKSYLKSSHISGTSMCSIVFRARSSGSGFMNYISAFVHLLSPLLLLSSSSSSSFSSFSSSSFLNNIKVYLYIYTVFYVDVHGNINLFVNGLFNVKNPNIFTWSRLLLFDLSALRASAGPLNELNW